MFPLSILDIRLELKKRLRVMSRDTKRLLQVNRSLDMCMYGLFIRQNSISEMYHHHIV